MIMRGLDAEAIALVDGPACTGVAVGGGATEGGVFVA